MPDDTTTKNQLSLKAKVEQHWQDETCGTRYGNPSNRKAYFDEISAARYRLEPYIPIFAQFEQARGKRILEIGVGAGADFQNWCKYAEHATGIDLTEAAIRLTNERLSTNEVPAEKYRLEKADAEKLPFADNTFDFVYSWGVLHHSPNTVQAFQEVFRVLKPNGHVRAMVYHEPSLVGLFLYLRYGLARGKLNMTMKQAIFDHLESPGTKAYTIKEARQFLEQVGFEKIDLGTKLNPGDLLTAMPSAKYQSPLYKVIWSLYPRELVRRFGDSWGTNLLISASKPALSL